ncbi:MAG: N-acetylneuraminate synthase family protein [Prochlorococcaceae cyanobacterium]
MVQFHQPELPYVCNRRETLTTVLDLIKANSGFPVVLTNDDQSLYGVVSSGDIAGYLTSHSTVGLDTVKAEDVANQMPVCGHVRDGSETIEAYLTPERIRSLPILDMERRVVRVATRQRPYLDIGNRRIKQNGAPFLLAEIGVNHNGDIGEAIALIQAAAKAGFDGVKFQHRGTDLYNKDDINRFDLGTQYIIAEIERTRLPVEALKECCQVAKQLNLAVVITPFDEQAFNDIVASEMNPDAIKIASCDLNNTPLIQQCAEADKPLIISTGMSYERDIIGTCQLLRKLMVQHAFLHCNSTYPAPPHDINLAYIARLRDMTATVVGYSSHDGSPAIPVSAVGCGADIVEVHITRSRESKGTDHRASLELNSLAGFVEQCRLVYEARGKAVPRVPSQGELANRQSLGKSYALREPRPAGHRLKRDDLILISPGSGFTVDTLDELLGQELSRDVGARTLLTSADFCRSNSDTETLAALAVALRDAGYEAGIPVRYHDAEDMAQKFQLPLLEFHMSDRDLELTPSDFIHQAWPDTTLVVHAVEQYEDGFILDLASGHSSVLERSFREVERLTQHVDQLSQHFRPVARVPIVLNLGGFSSEGFMNEGEASETLGRAVNALQQLSAKHQGYEFLPQTMPPFPWHQGGRSFHNLLTSRQRIKEFLESTDTDICLDVSHSALACAHFEENIEELVNDLAGRIRHVHLSDAQGTNAEGLEVGDGSLNFRTLHVAMQKGGTKLMMIPEIWQGHVNGGEKFARSLRRFYELIRD